MPLAKFVVLDSSEKKKGPLKFRISWEKAVHLSLSSEKEVSNFVKLSPFILTSSGSATMSSSVVRYRTQLDVAQLFLFASSQPT
ncbi:hypothetical protein CEXT_195131 [Caerostris extrusa]|uniref:Uncharacterized protein n=1 Tax=Caerostris extrusa TaxID=172846 RepID=A0AAV4MB40_CAEEX|nr:hypothetical protein CEXT_195131 [Caerostris extrusa]